MLRVRILDNLNVYKIMANYGRYCKILMTTCLCLSW